MIALLKWFIRFYQYLISPLFPPSCRFFPNCSSYAYTAVEEYGIKGVILSMRRLLRCHPLNPGGYDPVPLPEGKKQARRVTDGAK